MDYLTWTYFFRRLLMNPTYYGLESAEEGAVNRFLSGKVNETLTQLQNAGCITVDGDGLGNGRSEAPYH